MANTYTQIHLHIVIVVKYRAALLHKSWREELHRFITGMVQQRGHKMIAINCVEDHLHMLIGLRPNQALSALMQEVKSGSSSWINQRRFTRRKFIWQEGFGAFAFHKERISVVSNYIANQEEHHRKETMIEEYKFLLNDAGVDYDQQYLFMNPE